ncbi:MAG: serine/threonine-protein kinase [Myxococcaceae bacterium]
MACLTAEQVVAHLGRRLSRAEDDAVVEHLDTCAACREFVSAALEAGLGPSDELAAPRAESLEAPHPRRLLPGTLVGRFLVLERLGAGAMGSVYSAYDPRLERKVALKLLHPGRQGQGALLDEARALARLSHPNITAIHEVGEHTDQRAFMAMELVSGVTLEAWLRDERRSPAEVLHVMRQAADGLAAAHRAGLVHRDFKPSNVMVSAEQRAFVTDFGLVNADEGHGPAGTPAYMAPEQLAGGKADARSDQFAFACTLYEALAGVRPFDGTTFADRADAIRARRFAPGGADVPRSLRPVLERMLAAEPAERFESMDAVRAALEPRTRRTRTLTLSAFVVLVLLGLVLRPGARRDDPCGQAVPEVTSSWDDARRERLRQSRPGTGTGELESRLDAYAARLTDAFHANCVSHERREDVDAVFQKRRACLLRATAVLGATVSGLQQPAGAEPSTVESLLGMLPDPQRCRSGDVLFEPDLPSDAEVATAVNEVRVELVRLETAFVLYQWRERFPDLLALQARAHAIHYPPLTAQVDRTVGKWQFAAGAWADAHRSLLDAASVALSIGQDEVAVECLNVLSTLDSLRLDRPEEAQAFSQLSLAISDRPRVSERLRTQTRLRRGMMFVNLGRYEEARRLLEGVLVEQEPLTGGSSGALTSLGAAERGLGELDASRRHLERSVALVDAYYSGSLRPLGDVRYELGKTLLALGDASALGVLELAARGLEESNGAEHVRSAEGWLALAQAYLAAGRKSDAAALAAKARAVFAANQQTRAALDAQRVLDAAQ